MASPSHGASFQAFVDDFADRTRQLKSMILLHSAQPDEGTHESLEEIEAILVKAERSMNELKCKIASETQSIRRAEESIAIAHQQAEQTRYLQRAIDARQPLAMR